jgi:UDP-3-O-acyl-N-acetylglucosamine deacetylase
MSTVRQQTISTTRELEGTGLHTGEAVKIRLLPAAVNTGICFRRSDSLDLNSDARANSREARHSGLRSRVP